MEEAREDVAQRDARAEELAGASAAVIKAGRVEPTADMARERARGSFASAELEAALAGGANVVAARRAAIDALKADPVFTKRGKHFLSREELHAKTVAQQLAVAPLAFGLGTEDPVATYRYMREQIDEPGPLDLHLGMFIPTIEGQGDEEQRAHWLPHALSNTIIGTYAQTELGHGTYLRGLETTATFDPQKDEWVIDSPTLTATKWWPGGLGKTATHVICMARLFTKGKDHGPHAFVVQIRSLKDHAPLPGIEVGDIGSKMGYNAMDNGFLRFDHVRVPRRAMLMKHARVSPDGTYAAPPVAKVSYGTMVFVRSDIVMSAATYLKKAVTIAVRYNAVRRQSSVGADGLESQVLDYQHCQRTLFSLLATAYAYHFTAEVMKAMYFAFEKESRASGDFSALPELHATSSGLKAICTWRTKDGIELCRLACGGHGFMTLSGLPTTLGTYMPNVTYEGENNVLLLQTARYLLKACRAAQSGTSLPANVSYLANTGPGQRSRVGRAGSARDVRLLLAAYAHRAGRMVSELAARAGAATVDAALAEDQVQWIKAAAAHCELMVLNNFADGIAQAKGGLSTATQLALQRLLVLHALTGIEDNLGDYMIDGFLDGEQARLLSAEIAMLLGEVRPDAIALTDAFGLDDYFLDSALGGRDGDCYRALYEAVQGAPFNRSHLPPGYHENLKPVVGKGVQARL